MIKDVEIKKATADDVKEFYPNGSPRTCYAWIAHYKGKAACLAGLIVERGGYIAFSDVKPNDAPKMTIWRTIQEMMRLIKSLNLPVIVCTRGCSKLMERLGFIETGTRDGWVTYKLEGDL